MENDYSGVLEAWKVQLVISRARLMGFRGERLEDALQELVPLLARFRHDPAKANGGTEATALTVVIMRRLSNIIRTEQRTKKREERCPPSPTLRDDTRELELSCDVRLAMDEMSPLDREVCLGLGRGKTQEQIAAELNVSRDVVRTRIDHIRLRFLKLGLDEWVCGESGIGKEHP